MGLNQQPEIANYWNKDGTNLGIFGCDFIQKLISRDKWWQINEWISFPVDLMIFHLNANFRKHWNAYQHVAIDEIMVLFKGLLFSLILTHLSRTIFWSSTYQGETQ